MKSHRALESAPTGDIGVGGLSRGRWVEKLGTRNPPIVSLRGLPAMGNPRSNPAVEQPRCPFTPGSPRERPFHGALAMTA